MKKPANICCICNGVMQPWPGSTTCFGNNPDPIAHKPGETCCTECDNAVVIPARIATMKRQRLVSKERKEAVGS